MAIKTFRQAKNSITKFIKAAHEEKLNPKKIILFGSYAKKQWGANSDIDICVIDNYTNKTYTDKLHKYSLLKLKSDIDLSIVLFSEKDLQVKLDPLAAEIRKWGIEIYKNEQQD